MQQKYCTTEYNNNITDFFGRFMNRKSSPPLKPMNPLKRTLDKMLSIVELKSCGKRQHAFKWSPLFSTKPIICQSDFELMCTKTNKNILH